MTVYDAVSRIIAGLGSALFVFNVCYLLFRLARWLDARMRGPGWRKAGNVIVCGSLATVLVYWLGLALYMLGDLVFRLFGK